MDGGQGWWIAMCCRYWMEESPRLREIVKEVTLSALGGKWQKTSGIKTRGEIRPSDVVPVIAPDRSGHMAVFPMKWGYSGEKLLINARVETAAIKPTFREDWTKHRCIVPASWYFEWEHRLGNDGRKYTGDKYVIQPKGSTMTWLCGLYRIEDGLPHFVILTREPGEGVRFIHDRMPLIMPEQLLDQWIMPEQKPEGLLWHALTDMVFEKAI
jgi:putative SOS response-associated peptidase YedK